MYTASNIRLTPAEFPRDEHPYGGWTYLSVFRERNYNNEAQDRIELDIGCIGSCSHSDEIQKWWHAEVAHAPEPQGWSSQIGNEVAVQFIYQRRWPAVAFYGSATHDRDDTRYFDIAPTASLYAGNVFITAGGGFVARANIYRMKGYFDGHGLQYLTPKSALFVRNPEAIDNANTDASSKSKGPSADSQQSEAFAYVKAEARVVGFNALIQGRMFGGSDPFTQDPQRVIVDLEVGVAAHIGRFSALVSLASRSTEVGLQEANLTRHRWRAIKLAYSF
jgi:hypothetical protein